MWCDEGGGECGGRGGELDNVAGGWMAVRRGLVVDNMARRELVVCTCDGDGDDSAGRAG